MEVVIVKQQIKNNDIINFVFLSLWAVLTMLFFVFIQSFIFKFLYFYF
jgi:hypothetical protein